MNATKCQNSCFSNDETIKIQQSKFIWKIPEFRTINHELLSPSFQRVEQLWRLKINPNSEEHPGQGNVQIRVTLHLEKKILNDDNTNEEDTSVCYSMAIYDRENREAHSMSGVRKFEKNKRTGFGFNLLSRAHFLAQSALLLPQECLTLCCIVTSPPPIKLIIQQNSDFLRNLADIFTQQQYGDIKIIIDKKEILAYKGILSIHSPVFNRMFSNTEFIENKKNVVEISDTTYGGFKNFLLYMYSNKLPEDTQELDQILYLSHKYDVPNLQALCEEKYMKELNINNAAEAIIVADKLVLNNLKFRIFDYLKVPENWRKFIDEPGFDILSGNCVLMKELIKYSTT
ncbi:speckle-type POZ protein-like [Aphidius gifuensis]|uniref:speckle-type POZ protein-like n=1 Tax=Aphidius gifuensis TaxID=684658 RepID=UPI001CDC3345|nr:speckle-type POZ protein-like [Aphidius gifuensis]